MIGTQGYFWHSVSFTGGSEEIGFLGSDGREDWMGGNSVVGPVDTYDPSRTKLFYALY